MLFTLDLVAGREGQYRVRLMDNKDDWDCAYPGVEVLPDGTFVTTTYGHWDAGREPVHRQRAVHAGGTGREGKSRSADGKAGALPHAFDGPRTG